MSEHPSNSKGIDLMADLEASLAEAIPKRTPDEWLALKHPHLRVLDPDGWRGPGGRPWTDAISELEFDRRLPSCTISGWRGTEDR